MLSRSDQLAMARRLNRTIERHGGEMAPDRRYVFLPLGSTRQAQAECAGYIELYSLAQILSDTGPRPDLFTGEYRGIPRASQRRYPRNQAKRA